MSTIAHSTHQNMAVERIRPAWMRAKLLYATAAAIVLVAALPTGQKTAVHAQATDTVADHAQVLIDQGRKTFRFDTFGDETFWGDTLKLHQAISGSRLGGVGPGVSPKTALAVGLKVDVDALPEKVVAGLKAGRLNLDDPDTTLALLSLNAVVGVTGFLTPDGKLRSLGIQCALCHSTVDNSFAPGIGHRLDAWANRDLNIGAIIALAPDLSAFSKLLGVDDATVRAVFNSWGPGKFDAELGLDGKAFRPDGKSGAVLIPPAFGMLGVNLSTWTGFGQTTYWNALVANLEMHGQGTFYDPRLNDATQFPVAAKAGLGHKTSSPDQVTAELAALEFYQLALPVPKPPEQPFNFAARRGETLFNGKAQCASCHVPPLFTEPGYNMHTGQEIGIDEFQSSRSPTHMYRTAPLRGLFTHQKGGFYHDGRFSDLRAVVDHYDAVLNTLLSDSEKADLIAYLLTL